MAAAKKAKPVAKVSSHTRRTPAGKRAQVENPAQETLELGGASAAQPMAPRICALAAETLGKRGETYEGEGGERQFHKVAGAFNSLTGKDLTGHHIALILMLVKAARMENYYITTGRLHTDSAVDGPAYFALSAEEINLQRSLADWEELEEG